jgi:hypothetical protein
MKTNSPVQECPLKAKHNLFVRVTATDAKENRHAVYAVPVWLEKKSPSDTWEEVAQLSTQTPEEEVPHTFVRFKDLTPGWYRARTFVGEYYEYELEVGAPPANSLNPNIEITLEIIVLLRLLRAERFRLGRCRIQLYNSGGALLVAPYTLHIMIGCLDIIGPLGLGVQVDHVRIYFLDPAGADTGEALLCHTGRYLDHSFPTPMSRHLRALGFTKAEPLAENVQATSEDQQDLDMAIGRYWFNRQAANPPVHTFVDNHRPTTLAIDLDYYHYDIPGPLPAGAREPYNRDTVRDFTPDPNINTNSHLENNVPSGTEPVILPALDNFHEWFTSERSTEAGFAGIPAHRAGIITFLSQRADNYLTDPATAPIPAGAYPSDHVPLRPVLSRLLYAVSDWEEIKERFESNHLLIQALIAFRREYFLGMILTMKWGALPGDPPDPNSALRFVVESVGSTAVTSDIDACFGGPDDVAACAEFNRVFRTVWGCESGTLMDLNIYFHDWRIIGDTIGENEGFYREDVPADRRHDSIQVMAPDHIADTYGLVKIRRYATYQEWLALVDGISLNLDVFDVPSRDISWYQRFDTADDIFRNQYVTPLLDWAGAAGAAVGDPEWLDSLKLGDPDRTMRLSNLAFAQLGAKVREMQSTLAGRPHCGGGDYIWYQYRGNRRESKHTGLSFHGFAALTDEYSSLMSEAALFASEAYNTQGAMCSIVGVQAGVEPQYLTPAHYLQAFNEQVGDALKEIRFHLLAAEAIENEQSRAIIETATGLYRSAKYEIRMKDLLEKLVSAFERDPAVQSRMRTHGRLFNNEISPDEEDLSILKGEGQLAYVFDRNVFPVLKDIRKREGIFGQGQYIGPDFASAQRARAQAVISFVEDFLLNRVLAEMKEQEVRLAAKPILPPDLGYFAEEGNFDYPFSLRYLSGHLLWQCAVVNRYARKILSRGPNELYVLNHML